MGEKRQLHEKSVEDLLDLIIEKKDLRYKVDNRLVYDIKNRNTRNVTFARKLLALHQAGMLEIKEDFLSER